MTGALSAAASPQPRVRLHREAGGTTAKVEEKSPPAADDSTVVAENYVVRESKLPSPPHPLREENRRSFSPREGGPLLRRTTATGLDLSLGVWRHADLFWEETLFKPQPTRAEFDVVRVKR